MASIAKFEMDEAGHLVGKLAAVGGGLVYVRIMPTTRQSRKGQPIWTGVLGTTEWRVGVTAYERNHPEYGRSLSIFSDGEEGETHVLNINQSDDLGVWHANSRKLGEKKQEPPAGGGDLNDAVPFGPAIF